MKAIEVFNGTNGDVTKAYYGALNAKGPSGQLATALFRAQKRSSAAKRYRGRKYTRAAYDVKNWSLSEICRILKGNTVIPWGWKRDPKTVYFEWVLYVDLPVVGQVSFHTAERLEGPDYLGEWDETTQSTKRILEFCDRIMGEEHTLMTPNFGVRPLPTPPQTEATQLSFGDGHVQLEVHQGQQ